MPEPTQVPVFIFGVGHQFEPAIRHTLRETVIESDSAMIAGSGQAGHTAHIFGNGHRIRPEFVYQFVCEGQIGDRLRVDRIVKVRAVVREAGAQSVMCIEHAGDAIETESIDPVLVEPEADIRKRKCST